ncbi:T9SS type A sorting domain-containing protein [Candidatus Dojkabacteria bacterium]|nr:T9SS type A sorting domain-containing protein [Candidatus Dojkabacteria bacterium]
MKTRNLYNFALTLLALFILVSASFNALANQTYSVTDLSIDCPFSTARSINNSGQIVGYSSFPNVAFHAFLWDNGVMSDIGTLGRHSQAYDINDSCQVVGTSSTADYETHGFLWENGVMIDMGDFRPASINNSGQIVGGNNLWEDGTITELDIPDNAGVTDINDSGQIVGAYPTSSGEFHAFLLENGVISDLGTLPGKRNSAPLKINNLGQIVGRADYPGYRAFLWENGTMNDLGTLGGADSYAYSINDSGQIVGNSYDSSGKFHAFLWENGIMTDLNSLIPADSGWELSYASDINNSGQIVGSGYINGESHAFLLTPEHIYHQITATAGSGGSILPVGDISIVQGASVEFTITPSLRYQIQDVVVDGVPKLADVTIDPTTGVGKYEFIYVTSDHTISASFVQITNPPSAPTIVSPKDGSTVANPNPTLVVNGSTDPEITYEFEVDNDWDFSSPILFVPIITQNVDGTVSCLVNASLTYGIYYWHARAYDGNSYSSWMDMASFEVKYPNIFVHPQIIEGELFPDMCETFEVSNSGNANLIVSNVILNCPYIKVSGVSFPITIEPNSSGSFNLTVKMNSPTIAGPGKIKAEVKIESNDPDGQNSTIKIDGELPTLFINTGYTEQNGFAFYNYYILPPLPLPIERGAHCLGMSLASLEYWYANQSLPEIGSMCNPFGIDQGGVCKYEYCLVKGGSPPLLCPSESLIKYSNNLWLDSTFQTLLDGLIIPSDELKLARTTYEYLKLKPLLLLGPFPLLFYNHAVVAYRVEEFGSHAYIHVYDSNYPLISNCYICLDKVGLLYRVNRYTKGDYDVFSVYIPGFSGVVTCPVDLTIFDPDGLMINSESTEIVGSRYVEYDINDDGSPDDQVLITDRKEGIYQIFVNPEIGASPTDAFTLKILSGNDVIVLVDNVQIGSISEHPYLIQSTSAGIKIVTRVAIDIKPGSDDDSVNLGSNGNVPVAILSSETFDATTVDPTTVTLANASVKLKGKGTPMASSEDVNGDGLLDLVIQIETEALTLSVGDTEAVLMGQTYNGTPIRGTGTVRIVPPEAAPAKPADFALLQNYPNSFNPDTWIPYQLAQDTDVLVRIYDATGNLVRTLNIGHKATGFYTTKEKAAYWDGKNEAGEQVASGIYFYSIQAGDFTATKKMVITR